MSKPSISLLLLLLTLDWSTSQTDSSCPYRCQCFNSAQVLCADHGMSSVPSNMSRHIREFILMTTSTTYLFATSLTESPQLLKLVFLNNAIRSIHAHTFQHLTQLQELEISGNPWLEHLYLGTFSKQHNLKTLLLNYNRFKTILPGMFTSLKQVETLQLKGNIISHLPPFIFANMSSLSILDLSINKLEVVAREMFSGLGSLEILKLNHNLLKNLSSDLFIDVKKLTELHLEGNKISHLSGNIFNNLTKLNVLNLRGNLLKTFNVDLFGLPLKQLILKGNHLSEFAPSGNLSSLIILDLSSNQLAAFQGDAFKNITNLEHLDLSYNHISLLPGILFNDLFNLKEVNLQGNNLTKLEPRLFEDQALIEKLDLSYNQLETLPEGFMDTFSSHHTIRLYENPWKCDCSLWYLHDWVLRNGYNVVMPARTLCESPGFLNRRAIDSVDKEQLVCRVAKDSSVDVRNCLLQVNGDAVTIKCKVETCLPLTVKVQLQDESGNVKEHVVRNEGNNSSQCSVARDAKANRFPNPPEY